MAAYVKSWSRRVVPTAFPNLAGMTVLIVGFYDRANLGDEAYKHVWARLFNGMNYAMACVDDLDELPRNLDVLIVGGGDVINPYFMDKIAKLAQDFAGPRYALSVGIPYPSEAGRLAFFDHSVVRSQVDYDAALAAGIPRENLSLSADYTWLLPASAPYSRLPQHRLRLGMCLAQPVFAHASDEFRRSFVHLIDALSTKYDIHLIPFNTTLANPNECDSKLNDALFAMCQHETRPQVVCHDPRQLQAPDNMMSLLGTMDVMLCMRYHSVQFSVKARRPFVAVYTTRKVDSLLKEIGVADAYSYRLPVDDKDVPIAVDIKRIADAIDFAVAQPPDPSAWLSSQSGVDTRLPLTFMNGRVRRWVRFAQEELCTSIVCTLERCEAYVQRLSGLTLEAVHDWTLARLPTLQLCEVVRLRLNMSLEAAATTLARTVCFAITDHISTPYVWGMSRAMLQPGFAVTDAIDWVRQDHQAMIDKMMLDPAQPPLGIELTQPIDLDYYRQDDFKGFHRSGWSYCLSGMYRIDAGVMGCRPRVRVDTYVDRSFNWGQHAMCAAGLLPYKAPWIGFVHHTFEQCQGENNCVELFRNALFLESLKSCACLIVLSDYLRGQVVAALAALHLDTPVRNLPHPMLTVDKKFTMERFLTNPNKKVVFIGCWLRNPYSVFELPLQDTWHNPLRIRKAILHGKNMAGSCEPDWLMPHMDALPFVRSAAELAGGICRPSADDGIGRPSVGDGICRPCDDGICRPGVDDGMCRPSKPVVRNTHVAGLVSMLHRQHDSVLEINEVTNDEYDDLLSSNIVFLDVVDCSAVNTVMECLVRDAVLLVNRHPALEEVLGSGYPGFYQNFSHAAEMLSDVGTIRGIHEYLTRLDKSAFTLAAFVQSFQRIVAEVMEQQK